MFNTIVPATKLPRDRLSDMCDAVYLQASLDGQHITPKRRNPNEVKIPKAWAIEYKPRDRSHTLRSGSVRTSDDDVLSSFCIPSHIRPIVTLSLQSY